MGSVSERRALDAFRNGIKVAPVVAQQAEAWGGLALCDWQLPWIEGFSLSENDDFVVALHSRGSRKVRAACGGPWSQGTSTPGLISVIPPGHRVDYRIDGRVSFASVHIPRQLMEGLTRSSFAHTLDFRFAFADAFASQCMDILLAEARQGEHSNFPYVHAITRALLMHLMQGFRAVQLIDAAAETAPETLARTGTKLDAMLDFIDANLAEPLRLEALAARASVSRAHFARRFRQLTGLSPHRYLTQRRIEKAKALLRDTRRDLADIALDVGFGNQSHFTQVFHQLTGKTPSQWRRSAPEARP
jgi:AraC family transcriptional regulator